MPTGRFEKAPCEMLSWITSNDLKKSRCACQNKLTSMIAHESEAGTLSVTPTNIPCSTRHTDCYNQYYSVELMFSQRPVAIGVVAATTLAAPL